MWRWGLLLLLMAAACAPPPIELPTAPPVAVPTQTATPVPLLTATLRPSPTPAEPQVIEGLLISEGEDLAVVTGLLSSAPITYAVQGADRYLLDRWVGETVRVTARIADADTASPALRVQFAQASTADDRLSLRRGIVKDLGISIYMQGSHKLVDDGGELICLLRTDEGGRELTPFLNQEAEVIGILSKTVEGDAWIMQVQRIGSPR